MLFLVLGWHLLAYKVTPTPETVHCVEQPWHPPCPCPSWQSWDLNLCLSAAKLYILLLLLFVLVLALPCCLLWVQSAQYEWILAGQSIDLGADKLCDLGIITSPLWTSEFSCIKWWSGKHKSTLDSPSFSSSSLTQLPPAGQIYLEYRGQGILGIVTSWDSEQGREQQESLPEQTDMWVLIIFYLQHLDILRT